MCASVDNALGSTVLLVPSSMPDARAIEGHWVGFDIDSTHTHRIYWPSKNTVSVKCNVKFVQPTIAVRIPFPLLPEGEQQSPAS